MKKVDIESAIVNQLINYHPIRIGIFGSYARNERTEDSDIDILVSFENPISLLQLISIENALSDKIGIKVDLVTENGIRNQKLKDYIVKDLKIIYNA